MANWQQTIEDGRMKPPPAYTPVDVPPTYSPNTGPSAMPAISAAMGLAPLDNAAEAFRRAPTAGVGTGAAVREAVVGAGSQGIERAANIGGAIAKVGQPVRSAIADFATGLFGLGSPAPAGNGAAPAPVATPAMTPMAKLQPANLDALKLADTPVNFSPTPVAGRSAGRSGPLSVNFISEDAAPAPAAAADPEAAISARYNDGTWSGMFDAKRMAKRVDAAKAAQVAAAQAYTGQFNANTARANAGSSRISADAAAENARSHSIQSEAQTNLIGENIKAAMNTVETGKLDLARKQEEANLAAAAANGDQKAMAKLRNLRAAQQGKAPEEAMNEKLLETYIKSVGEFNKDPSNMGKPAPSFQDFLGGLPPEMFPSASKVAKTNIANDPRAAAIRNNGKLSFEEKTKQLQAIGYR